MSWQHNFCECNFRLGRAEWNFSICSVCDDVKSGARVKGHRSNGPVMKCSMPQWTTRIVNGFSFATFSSSSSPNHRYLKAPITNSGAPQVCHSIHYEWYYIVEFRWTFHLMINLFLIDPVTTKRERKRNKAVRDFGHTYVTCEQPRLNCNRDKEHDVYNHFSWFCVANGTRM